MADQHNEAFTIQLDHNQNTDSDNNSSNSNNNSDNITGSTNSGTFVLPSLASATPHGNISASSGFALPAANPFTDSVGPQNPFSAEGTPVGTPIPTPLGSPTQELRKLSLGVERYARAIEDPGLMGSFSGVVPLPSLSQSHHQIAAAKRRPSHIVLDALTSSKSTANPTVSSPVDDGSVETSGRNTGLSLSSIKSAISGKRRHPDQSMGDLESNARGNESNMASNTGTVDDFGDSFGNPTLSSNVDAQAALLNSLAYTPQPLFLPATPTATTPLQEVLTQGTTSLHGDELRRRLEQSRASKRVTAAMAASAANEHARASATAGMRRRKPKGGILSQLLKLQRNEAAAAAAVSSSSSSASSSAKRTSGSAQHAAVKKTKKGFYYRSSSKNNSFVDLSPPSVTTTPKVSPRSSRLFELESASSSTTTRLPTQPSTSINTAASLFQKLDPHDNMEEMEAISAAATTATLNANLGIQRDIAEILSRQSFLIMIAKALILYGAPSHRIEETCGLLARRMDVDASFALLPGLMTISFSDPETHTSDTRHLRCTQGMDMYKLSRVYTIARGVLRGKGIEDANRLLESVTIEPGYYPVWVTVMSWMTTAAFVAPLAFNGSWLDTLIAGLCGLLVGVLGLVAAKFPIYGNVFEVTSSILVGFIAKAFGDRVCFSAVALAGVVVLLPGLLLTQAIMELASRNIVSGSVRMFYALMYAFFLGYGLSLGAELWNSITGDHSPAPASACEKGVDHWWLFLIFPAVSTSINIVFNAHPRQWLGMTIVTAVGFTVSYFLASGPQVTPAVSAFAVGIAGQAYGRLTGNLSYVPLLSGVLLLVPGSVGVKGVLAIIGSDPGQGFQFALNMVNISVSITLGVFCSALVWYPFWRKSTFMNF
ncbi:hypothetical protein BGZ51_005744 [Haplosporangium sp. Z 767]|nr:hypothetical protein BGZ50_004773 [Haplosporangium sp. Z 11]KAF9192351.1 hypothetical protein BGZ51_005744 [Haplosporangium sp. Z 767]